MVCSPQGSSANWIFQARILEWVTISLPIGSSQTRDRTHVSRIGRQVFTTEPPGKAYFSPIRMAASAAAKSLQLCPTLCGPIDGSPPGSPVPRILQARTLEWVAISFSSAWKWSHSIMSHSSWPHGLQPTRLLHPWDFPGKSTGVGCHCLLWLEWLEQKKMKSDNTNCCQIPVKL